MIEPVKLRKTITTVDAVPLAVGNLEQVREWIASKGGVSLVWSSEPPMWAITGLVLILEDARVPVRFGDWVAFDGRTLYAIPSRIFDTHYTIDAGAAHGGSVR